MSAIACEIKTKRLTAIRNIRARCVFPKYVRIMQHSRSYSRARGPGFDTQPCHFYSFQLLLIQVGAPEAQWVKRWPTDLAVRVRSLLKTKSSQP